MAWTLVWVLGLFDEALPLVALPHGMMLIQLMRYCSSQLIPFLPVTSQQLLYITHRELQTCIAGALCIHKLG